MNEAIFAGEIGTFVRGNSRKDKSQVPDLLRSDDFTQKELDADAILT